MNVWKVYVDGSNLLRVQHVSFNLIRVVINNPGCICCCSADSHVGLDGIFCVLWCDTRHEKWSQIAKLSLYNNNFAEKYMKVKTVEDEIFKLFCKIDCLTHQYNLHKKQRNAFIIFIQYYTDDILKMFRRSISAMMADILCIERMCYLAVPNCRAIFLSSPTIHKKLVTPRERRLSSQPWHTPGKK